MQNHMVGRRCRLTSGKYVGSDPNHGRLVGFAMLWLWNGEGHVSFQAEQCIPFLRVVRSICRAAPGGPRTVLCMAAVREHFAFGAAQKGRICRGATEHKCIWPTEKLKTQRMELSSSATSSCDHVTFQRNVFVFSAQAQLPCDPRTHTASPPLPCGEPF